MQIPPFADRAWSSPQLRYFHDPVVRAAALLTALIVYSSELGSFTLSIDEELFAYQPQWPTWVSQGRWCMALLSLLFPSDAAVPVIATLTFCLALTVAALLLSGCFARTRREAFAFVLLFASCPVWPHVAEFNQLAGGFGAGLVLMAIAVALLQHPGSRPAIAAGLIAGVALGIHQSLIAIFLCGVVFNIGFALAAAPHGEPPASADGSGPIARSAIAALVAIAVYVPLAALALALTGLHVDYVDSYVRVGEFLAPATALISIERVAYRVLMLVSGRDALFLGWGAAVLGIAWLGTLHRLWRIGRNTPQDRAVLLATGLLAIAAAGSTLIGSAGGAPARSLGALALLYALAGAATMNVRRLAGIPQLVLLVYAVTVNVWITTALFNADAIARQRDAAMASALAQRISAIAPAHQGTLPFTVVGYWRHENAGPAVHVEQFGTSFFEQDEGNVWRIHRYLELMGISGLSPVGLGQVREQLLLIRQMPVWPSPRSIAIVNGVLLIKLGPVTARQRVQLTASDGH